MLFGTRKTSGTMGLSDGRPGGDDILERSVLLQITLTDAVWRPDVTRKHWAETSKSASIAPSAMYRGSLGFGLTFVLRRQCTGTLLGDSITKTPETGSRVACIVVTKTIPAVLPL